MFFEFEDDLDAFITAEPFVDVVFRLTGLDFRGSINDSLTLITEVFNSVESCEWCLGRIWTECAIVLSSESGASIVMLVCECVEV